MANIKQEPRDENGERHGEWVEYHSNGRLYYRCNYFHGQGHGLWEAYHKDGKLWFRKYYNMGKIFGYFYYESLYKDFFLCLI